MRDRKPKSHKAEVLREYLRTRGFEPGDLLPGERELAQELGIGRTVLRPLLATLETDGIIERRPQSGTRLVKVPLPRMGDTTVAVIAPLQGTGEPERRNDPVWLHRVISALERVALTAGVQLVLKDQSPVARDHCSVKDLVREAIQEKSRAVILIHPVGTRNKIIHALALLHDAGIHPVIVSSRTYPGLASQVYFDSGWGAHLATRYLLLRGHQRIGFAGGPDGHEWVQDRLHGYRNALEAGDLNVDDSWVWLPLDHGSERLAQPDDGRQALSHFLSLRPAKRPTAIVAANDLIAVGIMEQAQKAGVTIPGDISLIGFDNDPDALRLRLTTVARPTETLGEVAAQVALERIAAGPEADTITRHLRPVIIERETVASPSDRER